MSVPPADAAPATPRVAPIRPADVAPGWHPDQTDAALLRYWDGAGWTPHTTTRALAPRPAAPAPAAEPVIHRTARLSDLVPEHTTLPTPPSDRMRAVSRPPAPRAGATLLAAAALVVACTALAVAMLP